MKIEENIDLKKYNTYGVGGKARFFVLAKEKQDLIDIYSFAKEKNIPLVVLGGGSNILISDNGYNGLVVVNKVSEIRRDGDKIIVSSGLTLAKMIKFTIDEGLTGAEFLAGIPGTLGGAILGNAGAWGKSIGDVIESVDFLDKNGEREIQRKDMSFNYRESSFKRVEGVILGATLVFTKSSIEAVSEKVKDILAERRGKHPVGRSCGSFFKNVEVQALEPEILNRIKDWGIGGKVAAGKLIEESGCRGMNVGDAQVSEVHANFLVNAGDATSSDIKDLAEKVKQRVYEKFEIELEPEIRYL